jgi:sigma-B regulation protein RsbU (phosphoserine phosphatase)
MPSIDGKELAEALLGAIFMAVGLSAAALSAMRVRTRDRSLLWFGLFAALYGLRLLSHSSPIRELTSLSPTFWQHWIAFLSYLILVPVGFLAEAFIGPGWRGSTRLYVYASIAGVIVCMAIDLTAGRAETALPLNQLLVVAGLLLMAFHLLPRWREARHSRPLAAVMWSGALFAVIAAHETFTVGSIIGRDIDLEPVALLVFVCAVGYFAASRVFDTERRLSVIASELDMARQIQQSILPRDLPKVHGLSVAARYVPMTAVAGDFYDFHQLDASRLAILVADVSGHGVPAALIASMVKIAVAAQSEHASEPGRVLESMNRVFRGKLEKSFITAAYAVIDRDARSITYSSAGHPPAIVARADGTIDLLSAGGIMLGFAEATYPETTTPFVPGDRLLLYTDGLIEAPGIGPDIDIFFGDAELPRAITAGARLRAEAFADALLDGVTSWAAPRGGSLADDVTFVVVDHEVIAGSAL